MRIGNTINLIDFFLAIKIRLLNTPRAKQSPKATQIDAFLRDEGGGGGRVAMIIIDRLVFNVNKIYVLSPVWRELLGGSVVSSKSVNS